MNVSATNVTAKNRLMHLMAFLEKEVESEERIHMAKTCFEDNPTKSKEKKKPKSDREQDIVTAAGLLTMKESTSKCSAENVITEYRVSAKKITNFNHLLLKFCLRWS